MNEKLKTHLPLLKKTFSNICISTTPSTAKQNNEMLQWLEDEGCHLTHNLISSTIGDHFRNAMKLALTSSPTEAIFFDTIDRVLFAVGTEYRQVFFSDLLSHEHKDLHLFHRTEKAWLTHPENYRDIEQGIDIVAHHQLGMTIELGLCAFIASHDVMTLMLKDSSDDTFAVVIEWVHTALFNHRKPTVTEVDWLSWEDPYIENRDPAALKRERESSRSETKKRLVNAQSFLNYLSRDLS